MRPLLIHIGFPKSASTTLQRHAFPNSQKYRYLGKLDGLNDPEHAPVTQFIRKIAYETKDQLLDVVYKEFSQFLLEEEMRLFGNCDINKPLFISNEWFTAECLRPRDFGFKVCGADPELLFHRLAEFAEKQKYLLNFLLIQRNTRELIHSWYAQYYHHFMNFNSTNTLQKFLATELSADNIHLGLKWLFEGQLTGVMRTNFLKNHIHEFHIESLISQNGDERMKMEELLGIDLKNVFLNVENRRDKKNRIKIAHMRIRSLKPKNFFKSLKLAIVFFKWSYYSHDKLVKEIEWDNDCDRLYQKISNLHKDRGISD